MTKVDFYTGAEDKLRTACKLCHKAMQNNLRVLLHTPDEATTDALDKLLWQYSDIAFVPHCRSDEPNAGEMPVVIGHDSESLSIHAAARAYAQIFQLGARPVARLHAPQSELGQHRVSLALLAHGEAAQHPV